MMESLFIGTPPLAVVPILIGPLQVLLAVLPAILVAIGGVLVAMLKPSSIKIGLQVLWRNKVSSIVAVALIAGGIYGFSRIPGCQHGQAEVYRGKAEWTMFRGGLERRGAKIGDTVADPTGGGVVWSFAQKFKTYYSSPALVGNRVVATAGKKEVFTDAGAIHCLDADHGSLVWEFAPSDLRATFSSPAVAGKYVVCGEGLHEIHDARIVCLSFETGKKLWDVRASSHVESSPCISGNQAFCGAGADGIYGLWLDPPAGASPVAWHVKGLGSNALFHCDSSPAVTDGRVYLGSAALHPGDWSGVACLDAATGKEIWHVDTPMPVWGSPTIVSNRLFFGMGNGNFVESAEQYWMRKQQELRKDNMGQSEIDALAPKYAAGGEIWALDARTGGKPLWIRKLHQTLLGAVAAADGRLYFAALDGMLTCITLDNELIAQWDTHEKIKTSPAVGRDHVYVVTDSGRLIGLDRRTLRPVWQTRLGNGDLFTSSPAVGGGHIYVGTPENGLVCIGTPPDRVPEPLWPGVRGGAGRSGCLDGSALPAKGSYAWRWPSDAVANVPLSVTPAAFLKGTLYAAVSMPGQTGLVALAVGGLSLEGGVVAHAPESNMWFAATALPLQGSVAATTNRVYFVEGQHGQAGRQLHCVRASDGRDIWRAPIDAGASGELLLTTSNLFACVREGQLSCFDIEGTATSARMLWSTAVGCVVGTPCAAGDLILVATSDRGVMGVESLSGQVRWRQMPSQQVLSSPVVNDDVAVIATQDRLKGLSLDNGAVLWQMPCNPAALPLCADEERVVCVTTRGQVLATTWGGKELFRIDGARPDYPVSLLGDSLLFADSLGALQKAELGRSVATIRWLDAKWLGPLVAPPLLGDGVVYFSTLEKGLICARQQGKR